MPRMRIAIVTDAWKPQVNGVVQTLSKTRDELEAMGHDVLMLTPAGRRSIPLPTYAEICRALLPGRSVRRELDAFDPDCIHIATEGTLGLSARAWYQGRGLPFTTAYHTQFPEYLRARAPIQVAFTVSLLRWFHRPAKRTMVPTERIRDKLEARGFRDVVIWSRGVDTELFSPAEPFAYDLPRPIWIHMGRVAVEKNIEQFLNLDLPGTKIIIGDGPIDDITSDRVGVLDEELGRACERALALDRRACRAFVEDRNWRRSTLQFESYLAPRTRATASAQPESSASR